MPDLTNTTEISTYLPNLTNKEIGTIFCAVASLVPLLSQHCLVCFKATSRQESGVWPNNSVGTFIDNVTLRIGVDLRVGLSVCIPHRCKCGKTVDEIGTHPLSCRFSHSSVDDVVRRSLSAAGMPFMYEPSGLNRGDGNRPDGIRVDNYSRGRCLIRDAVCVNTFASSKLTRGALAARSVADDAEIRKITKCAMLGRRIIFQPVAVETSGAMRKSTIKFL